MAQVYNDMEDFETLLQEQGDKKRRYVHPGERIRGKVVFVGEKHATVDLGDGLDGLLDLAGTQGKDGKTTVKVGDIVESFVLRMRDRVVELAKSIGKGMANAAVLQEAASSGVPVDGIITGVNKGGYEVDVSGTRGFCPLGQMDVRRIEDPATLINQSFKFRVTEFREGRDCVLSRRALLEADVQAKASETRKLVVVGAHLQGTVSHVRDFGCFVDLGGLEGMVPASEMAYGRNKPQDLVQAGQVVTVEVLRIEPGLDNKNRPIEKILLSMRALSQDPFEALAPALQPGVLVRGHVTRVEAFGAFVELIAGVEGLIHISAFGKRIGRPSDVVQPGQAIVVRVDGVDLAQRRIGLGYVDAAEVENVRDPAAVMPTSTTKAEFVGVAKTIEPVVRERMAAAETVERQRPAPPPPPIIGAMFDVIVDKIEQFGVFVHWDTGRGLVPNGDLGLPFGADARRLQPIGSSFRAVVLEVRPDGKVRLSKTAAAAADERSQADSWLQAQHSGKAAGGVGSFGALLMQKLQDHKK